MEDAGLPGEKMDAVNAPVGRPFDGQGALIPGEEKRGSGGPVCCLNFDEALGSILGIVGEYVVAGAISFFVCHPTDFLCEIDAVEAGQPAALDLDDKLLTGSAERAVALVPFNGIELADEAPQGLRDL